MEAFEFVRFIGNKVELTEEAKDQLDSDQHPFLIMANGVTEKWKSTRLNQLILGYEEVLYQTILSKLDQEIGQSLMVFDVLVLYNSVSFAKHVIFQFVD
jgi:hypothetical protein